jgi:hypothetical protein
MLLDRSVIVQNKSITYDSEGGSIEVWTASQTAERANKQPLSGEIAFKEYGITEAGISDLFFMATSTAARESGRLVDSEGTYEIYRIEKYSNHYEVIAKSIMRSDPVVDVEPFDFYEFYDLEVFT